MEFELNEAMLDKLASEFTSEELEEILAEAQAEQELDKLASQFTEDELAALIDEVEAEETLDKLASMFSAEELEEIIKEAQKDEEGSEDKEEPGESKEKEEPGENEKKKKKSKGKDEEAGESAEEEANEDEESEKMAAAYYELGQIMAQGFQAELDKQASLKSKAIRGVARVAESASHYGKKALEAGHQMAQSARSGAELYRKGRSAGAGRMQAAREAYGTLTPMAKRRLKQLAGGAAAAGAVGTAGAGYAAKKMMGREKKSSVEEVYEALAVLAKHELI